jgi:hypothetical protein
MCNLCVNDIRKANRRRDPTRTTQLRHDFEDELVRRFKGLRKIVEYGLVEKDMLGLQVNVTAPERIFYPSYEFRRSPEKLTSWRTWLDDMVAQEVFEVVPGTPLASAAQETWTSTYIKRAYNRGIQSAASEMSKAGADIADRWIDAAFTRPIHADSVGLIYTRTYEELKGVTDEMAAKLTGTLARGMAEGIGPRAIASRMAPVFGERDKGTMARALRITRTESIAAHAEATLNAYQEAGIHGVEVIVEWLVGPTIHEDAPCEECLDLQQQGPYTLDEARGLIPVHPNCRCGWRPRPVLPDGLVLQ